MRRQRRRLGSAAKRSAYFVILFLMMAFAFSAVPLALYSYSLIDIDAFNFTSYAAMSLAFPATAIIYLSALEPSRKGIAKRLGLGPGSFSVGNVLLGVVLFLVIFSLELLVGLLSTVTGVQIDTNATSIFISAPLWFYVFAAIVSPINEEIVFRGLFVPRLGIVLSAAMFGILHYSYNSTYGIEVIAAFIFAVISGYAYKKTNSLYPSIVAHILVNTLTVITAFSMLGWVR